MFQGQKPLIMYASIAIFILTKQYMMGLTGGDWREISLDILQIFFSIGKPFESRQQDIRSQNLVQYFPGVFLLLIQSTFISCI